MAAKFCPFVMVEIVLPELFEGFHQPVSAQFSIVSNLFLATYIASKLSMVTDYYEDTANKCR